MRTNTQRTNPTIGSCIKDTGRTAINTAATVTNVAYAGAAGIYAVSSLVREGTEFGAASVEGFIRGTATAVVVTAVWLYEVASDLLSGLHSGFAQTLKEEGIEFDAKSIGEYLGKGTVELFQDEDKEIIVVEKQD